MSLKPKVALSQDFLLQLAKLAVTVQTKVMRWAILFQSDPTSAGINYESIHGARDPNLKSVRIDRDWRGIVFKPSQGDVYVLLHVDHHDQAYRWAENRKLTINPVTGAMQLVTLESVNEEAAAARALPAAEPATAASAETERPLFKALDDRDLMSLGVPEDLVGSVRDIASETQLDAMQARLPVEAYEGLFLVAAGDTVNQVLEARETRVDRTVDTGDFATALETPESRSRFVIVDGDEAMVAIMSAPLEQWRVFLHPTQSKLVNGDRSGPVRVLGGAGTGKTVVAMHRAKWLAEHRTPAGRKVLFTTFTRNLANDIEQNLRTLCSRETLEKVEVRNLDAWVHGFMRAHKLEHRIVYDRKQDGAQQAWEAAMAVRDTRLELPDNFYQEELEQVVLAQGISTLDDYRTARRTGRGTLLSRAKRDAIWPVFEEYRGQLSSRKLKEVDDAYREVAELLGVETRTPDYSAVVIDETQDFGPQALKLIRAMVPAGTNDLFFVGDGHQRIYSRNRAAMSKCGIEIRGAPGSCTSTTAPPMRFADRPWHCSRAVKSMTWMTAMTRTAATSRCHMVQLQKSSRPPAWRVLHRKRSDSSRA
ncbi:UvrD-helicase domain-containing protein [Ottowia pentelensis]|uniref:UvrD-helicase domain-containing protein n=1 Tax=Ottowia pentelensis TaxID=511108 RepID=UPI00364453D0